MSHSIVNREEELGFLESLAREERAQFVILYGRRRVGKTFLIQHFLKDKPHVSYQCSEGNETEQIRLLSGVVANRFNDKALSLNPFTDWHSLFNYLADKTGKERTYISIDEFPLLVTANGAVSSIFQKYWDEHLSKTRIFLILCGSSISMMERETLAYKSPLYGRRTGQWKVEPLKFHDVSKFFKGKNPEKVIEFYSVTGGIPFYLEELDLGTDIRENILLRIAKKGRILYEEGELLIKEELKEPATYFSIIEAIATGKSRQTEIANCVKMESTSITRYLTTLIRLGFIERIVPVTEKKKTKKALYVIRDPFMAFWFKFVYPNKSYIESGEQHRLREHLDREFNRHVSIVFESVCTDFIRANGKFDFKEFGKWWGSYSEEGERKTAEIDIVATNKETKDILFGECKWSNDVDAEEVLRRLRKKAELVEWNKGGRTERFAIFAKSFKRRVDGASLFDLKDL